MRRGLVGTYASLRCSPASMDRQPAPPPKPYPLGPNLRAWHILQNSSPSCSEQLVESSNFWQRPVNVISSFGLVQVSYVLNVCKLLVSNHGVILYLVFDLVFFFVNITMYGCGSDLKGFISSVTIMPDLNIRNEMLNLSIINKILYAST